MKGTTTGSILFTRVTNHSLLPHFTPIYPYRLGRNGGNWQVVQPMAIQICQRNILDFSSSCKIK